MSEYLDEFTNCVTTEYHSGLFVCFTPSSWEFDFTFDQHRIEVNLGPIGFEIVWLTYTESKEQAQ